jgi:tryptophan 2-monooxygenase
VGKFADIIAMPGNPFEDINVTGQVDFVMKRGVIYKQPSGGQT